MSLGKWTARKGAVGGTARWAAKGYKYFRGLHPDPREFADDDIYRLLIVNRFKTMPDPRAEKFLLGLVDELLGLRALVIAVLTVEARYMENAPSVQAMFSIVIDEELESMGIPHEVIVGRATSPVKLRARRPTSRRVGSVFLVGTTWTVIAATIGWIGFRLASAGGSWLWPGRLVVVVAFWFGSMFVWRMAVVAWHLLNGIRLARKHPSEFAAAQRSFNESRLDEKAKPE